MGALKLVDFLFPKFCIGCGKFGTYLCNACVANIVQAELVCPNCEKPSVGGVAHPLCRKKYGLDGLWSLGAYKDPLKKAIQKLKYHFVADLAGALVNLEITYWARFGPQFLEEIKKEGALNWVIIAVPLHPSREKRRGFNQSALLGKILSKKLGLPYREGLKRIVNTKPQVGLSGWERKKNIKGAFSLTKPYTLHPNILLIDDVWTTGSTLKECCYVLKRGGAAKVWALTLAR